MMTQGQVRSKSLGEDSPETSHVFSSQGLTPAQGSCGDCEMKRQFLEKGNEPSTDTFQTEARPTRKGASQHPKLHPSRLGCSGGIGPPATSRAKPLAPASPHLYKMRKISLSINMTIL